MREEWTSVVAHDLRQPVSVILAYATMLSRQAATSASREKADHIASSARRLERMIGDLIDVSSIDSRRLSLRPEPTSLGELARAAVERAGAAVARPIELQVEPGLPPVSVDAARMEQVLANLLSNAQKYGAAGSPVVVDVRREPDGLAIHVSNEGNPIPPAEIPLLFRRFHRSRTARTGRTPGLGLGLYIARGIVEAHGGRVSVTSDEARTTFAVQIPVAGAQLG
jgi:signal transduction histidine kinase